MVENKTEIYQNTPDEFDEVPEEGSTSSFDYKPVSKVTNKQKIIFASVAGVILLIIIAFFALRSAFTEPALIGTRRTDNRIGGSENAIGMSNSASGIGLSVGGAYNIDQFRNLISQKYLPLPSDVAIEGLFSEYFFETGETETCVKLFCPSYSYAVTKDPFSQTPEYYLSVGLNSGAGDQEFKRPKLNLVVVLDISGSMAETITDGNTTQTTQEKKIETARKALIELIKVLNPDDRLAVVLFDDLAFVEVPVQKIAEMDMVAVEKQIVNIKERGGTNLEAGLEKGVTLFADVPTEVGYNNRMVVITDAQPNVGNSSQTGLGYLIKNAAEQNIYSTFIGVGLDFNSELVSVLSESKGANHFSVHSIDEFSKQLVTDFDYMVTPLIFDLNLELLSQDFAIAQIYGSPSNKENSKQLLYIASLFASQKQENQVKGGLILVKLRKIGSSDGKITIRASFKDGAGTPDTAELDAVVTNSTPEYFDTNGIRKGILLARYGELLKQWLVDEQNQIAADKSGAVENPLVKKNDGVGVYSSDKNDWDTTISELTVSQPYKSLFGEFKQYFVDEVTEIGDETLQKEVDILDQLD